MCHWSKFSSLFPAFHSYSCRRYDFAHCFRCDNNYNNFSFKNSQNVKKASMCNSIQFFCIFSWFKLNWDNYFKILLYLWYRRMITWCHILMMMRMVLWMMTTWMRALSIEWHVSWVSWRTSMVTSSVPASLSRWLPKYVHLIILSRLKAVIESIPTVPLETMGSFARGKTSSLSNRKLVYCDISLLRVKFW